jgi:YesN/AraC family two-component response regulator
MTFTRPILLVDDEAHIRKFVGLILKSIGATNIIEATNGEEAIAAYQREKPALVLLDVNMPVMSGLDALKKIREGDPEAVVVMLTSLANRQTVEEALELGALNYVRKDTPKNEISKVLTETLANLPENK